MLVSLLLACTSPDGSAAADTGVGDDTGGGEDTAADADPFVSSAIPANYAAPAPARVIFMGDSITAGSGAARGNAYAELLQENSGDWSESDALDLGSLWGTLPEVIDVSRGGATSNSFRYQQLEQVQDALSEPVSGPTVVITTIVGNDVQGLIAEPDATEETIADIEDNLATVWDYYLDPANFPDGTWIYLTNVYEPSDGVGQADACFFGLDLAYALDSLEQVNAAVRAQSEEYGIAWLDMNGHFKGHGYYAEDPDNAYHHPDDPSLWFDSDCIHPNDRGHHEIRRQFWYAVAGLPFPGDEADTVQ